MFCLWGGRRIRRKISRKMTEKTQTPEPPEPLPKRLWSRIVGNGRKIGSVAMVLVALVLAWNVVTGPNGLTSWNEKRNKDKALAAEIQQLADENAHLKQHVERLKADPTTIEHEARERLHYARPNEMIYALPEESKPTAAPAAPVAK